MRKALVTLFAAGTLAVPAGMALAQADTVEPTAPTPTCERHERARDRVNQQDPAAEHGQHRAENRYGLGDGSCTGDQTRTQTQHRDGTGTQVQTRTQTRNQDGTCDGDCTGDQTRTQTRNQNNTGQNNTDQNNTGRGN